MLELQVTAFLIVFARVGAVLMMLPVFAEEAVPGRIRLLIAGGMTFGMMGLLGPGAHAAAIDTTALPGTLLIELGTGLAMGAIVKIIFHAVSIAGSVISIQVGLSSAVLFDPAQGGQAPLLSKFVTVGATVVCMAMQVHHLWIASIIHSYATFPVGGIPPLHDFAELAVLAVGRSMTLGIGLAAPLLVYGIVFNVALGLSARLAPAIQIFFIAQPLNLLLGLAVTAVSVGGLLTGFAFGMADWMQSGWH